MNRREDQLEALQEIRDIMDRSSRFISLSGLSGVFAGLSALAGAAVVKWFLSQQKINYMDLDESRLTPDHIFFILIVAAAVLIVAFLTAIYFTVHNARIKQLKVWDNQSKRWLVNLAIPLATGGIFCAILLYQKLLFLVAPCMLIFYGLSLLNASKVADEQAHDDAEPDHDDGDPLAEFVPADARHEGNEQPQGHSRERRVRQGVAKESHAVADHERADRAANHAHQEQSE
jgi:hypothetical protein